MKIKFLRKLTIRKRLLFITGLVALLAFLFSAFSLLVYRETSSLRDKITAYREIHDKAKIAKDLQLEISHVWQYATDASLTKKQRIIEEETQNAIEMAVKNVDDLIFLSQDDPEQLDTLNKLKEDLPVLMDIGKKMFDAYMSDWKKGNEVMEEFDSKAEQVIQETSIISVRIDGAGERAVNEMFSMIRRTVMVTVVSGSVLLAASVLVIFFIATLRKSIIKPLSAIEKTAELIASGDLTAEVQIKGSDEIASLGISINRMSANLKEIISKVVKITESVSNISDKLKRSSDRVMTGAQTQHRSFEKTAGYIHEIDHSIAAVSASTETLARFAEQTTSAIIEISTSIANVAQSANTFSQSATDSASSVEEMVASMRRIAESVEALSASSEETSSSLHEINTMVKEVERHALESAEQAKLVALEATEKGMGAASASMRGMEEIRGSVGELAEAINRLGKRSEEIGKMLNVINEVADQTGLLALNAAILAAKAGEHGKGFAVVADEIKSLAGKTTLSTNEIASLVEAVKADVQTSIALSRKGLVSVDKGIELVGETNGALKSILESANASSDRAKFIQRSAAEETIAIRQITDAVKGINTQIEQISRATKEQNKGSELIIGSIDRIKEVSQHVRNATGEQMTGSKQISSSARDVSDQAEKIASEMKMQSQKSRDIVRSVEKIKSIAEESTAAINEMNEAVRELGDDGKRLLVALQRFKT